MGIDPPLRIYQRVIAGLFTHTGVYFVTIWCNIQTPHQYDVVWHTDIPELQYSLLWSLIFLAVLCSAFFFTYM